MSSFPVPTYIMLAINVTEKQEVENEVFSSESSCFMNNRQRSDSPIQKDQG